MPTAPGLAEAPGDRLRRGETGSSTVELVLIFVSVVVAILVGIQLVLWFHASQVATAAAQEGAQAARSATGSVAAGRAEAQAVLSHLGRSLLPAATVRVTRGPDSAKVVVRGRAEAVVPGLDLVVTGVSSGPIERYYPQGRRG